MPPAPPAPRGRACLGVAGAGARARPGAAPPGHPPALRRHHASSPAQRRHCDRQRAQGLAHDGHATGPPRPRHRAGPARPPASARTRHRTDRRPLCDAGRGQARQSLAQLPLDRHRPGGRCAASRPTDAAATAAQPVVRPRCAGCNATRRSRVTRSVAAPNLLCAAAAASRGTARRRAGRSRRPRACPCLRHATAMPPRDRQGAETVHPGPRPAPPAAPAGPAASSRPGAPMRLAQRDHLRHRDRGPARQMLRLVDHHQQLGRPVDRDERPVSSTSGDT